MRQKNFSDRLYSNLPIEYRGICCSKGKKNEVWIYGTLAVTPCSVSPILSKGESNPTDNNIYNIYRRQPHSFADWNMPHICELTPVYKESVGFYIGKKDVNGTHIFTGDLVAFNTLKNARYVFEIVYNRTTCGFEGTTMGEGLTFHFGNIDSKQLVVVGNIWEGITDTDHDYYID